MLDNKACYLPLSTIFKFINNSVEYFTLSIMKKETPKHLLENFNKK